MCEITSSATSMRYHLERKRKIQSSVSENYTCNIRIFRPGGKGVEGWPDHRHYCVQARQLGHAGRFRQHFHAGAGVRSQLAVVPLGRLPRRSGLDIITKSLYTYL